MRSRVWGADKGIHPKLRVRKARYLAAFAAIGCDSNMARARESGLDPKSIYSALKGEQIGEQFMAKTIATLQLEEHQEKLAEIGIKPTLDSLFEVTLEAEAVA